MLSATRALVFDLDDTLYPEREFVLSGFRAVDGWLSQEQGVQGFGSLAIAAFERGVRGVIFDEVLRELGVTGPERLIRDLVRVYREHRPSICLHADVRGTMEYFRPRMKLGLITDGYLETQRRKVAALGIGGEFETIIFSDAFGREYWKPSPRPYQEMMAQLGCAGSECVYVADNPLKDFIGARQLGWKTIRIRRLDGEYAQREPAPGYGADVTVTSLDELSAVLSSVF